MPHSESLFDSRHWKWNRLGFDRQAKRPSSGQHITWQAQEPRLSSSWRSSLNPMNRKAIVIRYSRLMRAMLTSQPTISIYLLTQLHPLPKIVTWSTPYKTSWFLEWEWQTIVQYLAVYIVLSKLVEHRIAWLAATCTEKLWNRVSGKTAKREMTPLPDSRLGHQLLKMTW